MPLRVGEELNAGNAKSYPVEPVEPVEPVYRKRRNFKSPRS